MSVDTHQELNFTVRNERDLSHEDFSQLMGATAVGHTSNAAETVESVEASCGPMPRPVVTPPVEIDRSALPFENFHLSAVISRWDQPRH
jgi:hypothetical protein